MGTFWDKALSESNPYIIAEVGQNHQGSIEEAIRYIETFSSLGADCIKFQMRNNKYLFDESVYNRVYNSENSFGSTYGEHREHLELSFEEFTTIRKACDLNKVDLCITPFDEASLSRCIKLGVDAIKVASFDLGNIPLLRKIAATRVPALLSTGGGSDRHVKDSADVICAKHNKLAILHCVSLYPCPPEELVLQRISELRKMFPEVVVGLSDHFNGILSGPLGFAFGARVFEKHVTFDRAQKGTDHPFSLECDGFRRFARDIHRANKMISGSEASPRGDEPVFKKLGKSVVACKDINVGEIITESSLTGRIVSPPMTPIRESMRFVGKKALLHIKIGEYLTLEMVSQ